ncbi:hypothetical protein OXX79_003289 [Metschnikowia pulcherrima]
MQTELCAVLEQINSVDVDRIWKGLKLLEAFLESLSPAVRKYHRSGIVSNKLASFRALQENFQYNVASGLLKTYSLLASSSQTINEIYFAKANFLFSGLLLIHPESRLLFGNEQNMALILSFLDPESGSYKENLGVSFVSLLIHILIKNVRNMRSFEKNNGCQILIHHLNVNPAEVSQNQDCGRVTKDQSTLHFKVIEFLILYLSDESELLALPNNAGVHGVSVREKADLFRPKFPGIDDLIESLNDLNSLRSAPYLG